MHTIRRSIAVLALVAAPSISVAQPRTPPQSGQPDLVPRELVLALLSVNTGAGGTDLRVGEAPDDIPPELVAPGAQIIGSVSQFGNATLVLALPQTPDSAIGLMEAHLLAGGWTRPPTSPARMLRRGFVGADFSDLANGMPNFICRGDDYVMLSSMYRTSGGSLLRVNYNRNNRPSMCTVRPQIERGRSPFEEAPIPTLRAPAGSMTLNAGSPISSMGQNEVTVSTRLSTQLSASDLVKHYDAQMRTAGWTQVEEGAIDLLAARTYRKTDEKNLAWTGVLYAISRPEGKEKDVALGLRRR
jgi:hypothetical protein